MIVELYLDTYTEHCSVWSYQTYRYYYYRQYADDEDFYGGRNGAIRKIDIYLFIFLLRDFGCKISTVAGRGH